MERIREILFACLLVGGIVLQLAMRPWSTPITWDGFGYHLYLPLTFVHHDLGMQDAAAVEGIFEKYRPSDTFYQAHRAPLTGHMVIRYTPGLALIHLPGFLVAHAWAQGGAYPADGLSLPYQIAATATALVALLVGLWAMLRVLRRYFRPWPSYLAVALTLYGTNLMDQAVEQQMMTHLYSFALYALLLLATIRLHERPGVSRALAAGGVLGLLVLLRPTNALAVFLPLLWPFQGMGPLAKLRWLWSQHKALLPAFAFGFLPPVLLLLGYWRVYAGTWFYDSYQNPGEGLDVFYPHIHKFLFSFRKGWLVHTPLMLLALVGLWRGKELRAFRLPLGVFLALFLYVVSSWTLWYYPGAFGQRAAVDILAVMALGLAAAITWAGEGSAIRRLSFTALVALLVLLLQFQIFQQRRGVRPPDRMTAAYYWKSFMDLEPDPAKQHLLLPERPTVQVMDLPPGYGHTGQVWTGSMEDAKDTAPDGVRAYRMDADVPYTPAFALPFSGITNEEHAWLEVRGRIFVLDTTGFTASLVTHMDHGGNYGYRAWNVKQATLLRPGEWCDVRGVYLTPHPRRPSDELRSYFWHQGGPPCWVKDLEIRRYASTK